jgi:hypothetical protein
VPRNEAILEVGLRRGLAGMDDDDEGWVGDKLVRNVNIPVTSQLEHAKQLPQRCSSPGQLASHAMLTYLLWTRHRWDS